MAGTELEYPKEPNPETVRLFRGLLEDTLRRHLEHADALDTKAWQALGVGSIVLGLGVAGDLDGWGLVVALVGYFILGYGVFESVRVREWATSPIGDELWRDAWYVSPASLDHTIVNALVQGEPQNRVQLERKAAGVRIALSGLVVEIVALTISAAVT